MMTDTGDMEASVHCMSSSRLRQGQASKGAYRGMAPQGTMPNDRGMPP